MQSSKVMSIDAAVRRFVEPGMRLHFAATPSRSNVAVRAVCRHFAGARPELEASSTGFHATMHLLARTGVARRLVGCFFGDNYPRPRPNPLYERVEARGVELEDWSLLAFVEALRAGALGHRWALTRGLAGSSLGDDLAKRGKLAIVDGPGGAPLALVAAARPDLTFVHVPAADPEGRALVVPPYGEGFWGAHAARAGVVITTERVVDADLTRAEPGSVALPPDRVIAVCEAPFGAHPQPLFASPRFGVEGYADDLDAYAAMRELGEETVSAARLARVMLGDDAAYADHFDLRRRAPAMARRGPTRVDRAEATDRLVVLAARRIASLARAGGHDTILAGIGQAFFASRLAKLLLDDGGARVSALVETGVLDFACGAGVGDFLLGAPVVRSARRLSSIEDALGAIVGDPDSRVLGVIGAAEVDERGDVNTSRLESGRRLVGSGGANDIASTAAEVVVVLSDEHKLVQRVFYTTSPGARVTAIVTPAGVLEREGPSSTWRIASAFDGGRALRAACAFPLEDGDPPPASPASAREAELLAAVTSTDLGGVA